MKCKINEKKINEPIIQNSKKNIPDLIYNMIIPKIQLTASQQRIMTERKALEPTRDIDQRDDPKLAKKIKNFIYDPNDVIGSGFSSKVYKGLNQLNNQKVAIKVIELSKIQNEVQKYLLNNEINALKAMDHKNVIRTIDILMTKNNVYIVTEFCQFSDLQQMIKNNKKIQQIDALNIIRDIVEGYIAIEQKNIIHRDLKTANIFLTKTGAKIADFGFCQLIGQRKPQIAYNVGSPAYMSPESYNQSFYSHKSDIWGIGIILSEMLIGETPDKTLTYSQMSNNLMNGRINFTQNQDVKQILISCFKRDINQRINSHNLLQNVVNAIEKQKNPKAINKDNRFTTNGQAVSDKVNFTNFGKQNLELKYSTDQKILISMSPAKSIHNPNRQFEDLTKQYPQALPVSGEQGSRIANIKKETISSSNMLQQQPIQLQQLLIQTVKHQQSQKQSKRMRSSVMMFQFLFRLLKYMGDISLPIFSFIKLLIFRHRIYIDQTMENIVEQNKIDLGNSELYKDFQFLKKKFDTIYLDKESSPNEEGNPQMANIMSKLANLSFIDSQCIKAYKNVLLRGFEELQNEVNQKRSNAFALWDYLMLEYQILNLYQEGYNDESITSEKVHLELILKEQPKSISKVHIDLLKIKCRNLIQNARVELPLILQNQNQQVSQALYPQPSISLLRHLPY